MEEEATGIRGDGVSRRAFLRKMAIVGFAGPIVASFTIDGLAGATEEETEEVYPGSVPNQAPAEQPIMSEFFHGMGEEEEEEESSVPEQDFWNQTFANQYFSNQFHSNQTYFPNQFHN